MVAIKINMSRYIKCLFHLSKIISTSRITGSESQGQEEAACVHPADATTGVSFTATNTVKFPSTANLVILCTTA